MEARLADIGGVRFALYDPSGTFREYDFSDCRGRCRADRRCLSDGLVASGLSSGLCAWAFCTLECLLFSQATTRVFAFWSSERGAEVSEGQDRDEAFDGYREFDLLAGEVKVPMGFVAYPRESLQVDPVKSHLWTADIVFFAICCFVAIPAFLGGILLLLSNFTQVYLWAPMILGGIAVCCCAWRAMFQWRPGWLLFAIGLPILWLWSILESTNGSAANIFDLSRVSAWVFQGLFVLPPTLYALWRFFSWNGAAAIRLRESMARRLGGGRGR